MDSPLLFPVELKENKIIVLDETFLPFREEYIEVDNLGRAVWALGKMKTRSLGQVLLFFYSCLLFKNEFTIDDVVKKFKDVRPTFDFLLLGEMLKIGAERRKDIKKTIVSFIDNFDKARRKRASKLANILPEPANILTICNINGELIYLYEELKRIGKESLFVVCETRPYLQGTRLTLWELRRNNIPCKLACDNQAAALMKEKKINCVITGADRATKRGDVINKIGTYSLARLAGHFNIPFYSLTQYPRDIDIDTIEIEERPPQEVFMYLEGDYSLIDAIYPSFDITRSGFITQCIEAEVPDEIG